MPKIDDNREYIVLNGEQIDELVRCKDCLEFKYCMHNEHNDPNGFCSWGERKEDAKEE